MYMYNYGIIQQGAHAVACIYTCVCIQLMICEFLYTVIMNGLICTVTRFLSSVGSY